MLLDIFCCSPHLPQPSTVLYTVPNFFKQISMVTKNNYKNSDSWTTCIKNMHGPTTFVVAAQFWSISSQSFPLNPQGPSSRTFCLWNIVIFFFVLLYLFFFKKVVEKSNRRVLELRLFETFTFIS